METISELLTIGADDAPAIGAPGVPPLTFAALRALTARTADSLHAAGLGRDDRVAIVLANGPHMATSFVTLAAATQTAPLNPAYRGEEFRFYLDDLRARALVVDSASESPAIAVARSLGMRVLRLVPEDGAGRFRLAPDGDGPDRDGSGGAGPDRDGAGGAPRAGAAEAGDTALILHTSGTTSRPKIVPLSHGNLCASARHIVATLGLGASDRCLNIMPLFHIHGLVAAVLSSLAAGGGVVCTPGFNALRFMGWLADAAPSWYTAVPTMHQAILGRAERRREAARAAGLRFIRSSSSSLPPQVMAALEEVFACPVIESYGMTEAAHQMTSNQLPPGRRKPGTVGVAAGPEVGVMGNAGALLPAGARGEVVIRGPNVMGGYENNPKANAGAFTDGWFRTGDQGVFDEDGFLTITGRLKEIINRGGEKISPREVDEVLLDHPAVAQVVTFAMPHAKLGEEVAAAIVLREGEHADERSLRDFAATRLADFKTPRKIIFLEEIPKGPTGKLQRIGLAEKLGLA